MLNQKYRLGLRAIKTAIAVFICMIFSTAFNRPDGFFAPTAAIICMQQTYNQTFKTGIQRVIGTVVGGITGYVILEIMKYIPFYSDGANVIVVPICLLVVIYLCNFINYKESVVISGIVLISVLSNNGEGADSAFWYVVNRVFDTTMGIAVAMIINRFFLPNKKPENIK